MLAVGLAMGLPTPASAQPAPPSKTQNPKSKVGAPFLWKIEGAKSPSWIFGTIHLARPDVATPPAPVLAAVDRADAVYTEIPMDPATVMSLMPLLLLPEGRTLDHVLGAKLTADLKSELSSGPKPATALTFFDRLKPWAAAVTLLQAEDQAKFPGTLALDMVLFQRAAMAGRETGGLETPAEQLTIFDQLSVEEQTAMLEDTLAQIRSYRAAGRGLTDTLAALYLAGDLETLGIELDRLEAAGNHPELSAKLKDRLLGRRNVLMAGRIVKKLRSHPEKSFFFAVGAAHLDGPAGILADLEKSGFRLTRTKSY